ncbi:ABC transporter ATP-binding protein [Corynebacterium hindlerae]|uniref:ABC transporter ATP-binding protein n=1 Tax=Corynebacterium hindlerae TaxID=699041 RepID=UPI0031B70646
MTSQLTLDRITQRYGTTEIISETSASIDSGQFVSLIGPSGCGKSTILGMIAGLTYPSTGEVSAFGDRVTGPSPERGMVFQDHALLPWLSAHANVEFGLRSARPELTPDQRHELASEALASVGLSHAAQRKPAQLSGGMQQRVGIARAFAINPKVLLLDEPFGALDALTRHDLQQQLRELWQQSRRTVVMVTHDVDEAIYLSDRILVMSPAPSTIIADLSVRDYRGDLREHLLKLLGHGD